MKRDKVIPVRVSPEEHAQIRENASRFGGTVAEFGRSLMLRSETGSCGSALQEMASTLSRLAQVTNEIENYELRNRFVELEAILWHAIKSSTKPETTGRTRT